VFPIEISLPIEIPPLRERREVISYPAVPKHAMEALVGGGSPGNIRSPENFIERRVILWSVRCYFGSTRPSREAERQAILDALRGLSGRIAGNGGAAERLGLT